MERTTLLTLMRSTHIDQSVLAKEAHMSPGNVYAFAVGGYCTEAAAITVLSAYNRLAGSTYTPDDVQWKRCADSRIIEERAKQSTVYGSVVRGEYVPG